LSIYQSFVESLSLAADWLKSEGYAVAYTIQPNKSGYHLAGFKDHGTVRCKVASVSRKFGKIYLDKRKTHKSELLGFKTIWVDRIAGKVGFIEDFNETKS
jgi:hypothetical protein